MFIIFNGDNKIFGPCETSPFIRPWTAKLDKFKYEQMPKYSKVTKILTFGKDKEEINKFYKFLTNKYPSLSFHIVSKGYSIEITHKSATKGKGNAFVCNLLNIDAKNAAHIGDSGNDINALPEVGTFIAMGNAMDEVKAVANYIGPSFENCGISKLFEELGEIQPKNQKMGKKISKQAKLW
ncbi:HAD hydrolase family protein [Mycoplasmopsis caviae]|nr:HAD hydrolase family protein [Mycoplasmopsis caviae]VDR42556.1 COF family HAD hydrolase protein [Mycoplasmopsis caviae]